MKRLTSYKSECKREMICRYEDCDTCEEHCPHMNEDNCLCLQEVLNKLAEYEDLEEQGKLLKLPCTVGDTVYTIYSASPDIHFIYDFQLDALHLALNAINGTFGKAVFLTKEEAESALKERNN